VSSSAVTINLQPVRSDRGNSKCRSPAIVSPVLHPKRAPRRPFFLPRHADFLLVELSESPQATELMEWEREMDRLPLAREFGTVTHWALPGRGDFVSLNSAVDPPSHLTPPGSPSHLTPVSEISRGSGQTLNRRATQTPGRGASRQPSTVAIADDLHRVHRLRRQLRQDVGQRRDPPL
jgi:hypothetical protein